MTTPEPSQSQSSAQTERRLNPLKRKGQQVSVPWFPEDRFLASLLSFVVGCIFGGVIVSLGLSSFGAGHGTWFMARLGMEPVGYGPIGLIFWGVVAVLAFNADLKYIPAMFIGVLAFHYLRSFLDFNDMGMDGMNFTHPSSVLGAILYLGAQWFMWRRVMRLMREPHSS